MNLFNLSRKKNTTLQIPNSWDQLTIGQYEEILEHFKRAEEIKRSDEINETFNYNEAVFKTKVVASSVSKMRSEFGTMPYFVICNYFDTILNFIRHKPSTPFVNEFVMNGTTYIVNPDIRLNTDQFIQREKIVKAGGQHKYSDLVALYVWPKDGEFKIDQYSNIAKLLYNHCPCSILIPLSDFFLELGQACSHVIESYLSSQLKENLQEIRQDMKETLKESNQTQG